MNNHLKYTRSNYTYGKIIYNLEKENIYKIVCPKAPPPSPIIKPQSSPIPKPKCSQPETYRKVD